MVGRREVFPGRVTSVKKSLGVGIKICWRPKGRDLIKKMKIIPCGPPSLLHLNSNKGGRASPGESSPLRDRNSANPAFPTVLSGATAWKKDIPGPQGKGPFLRSPRWGRLWTSWRKGEGARWFSLSFLELWPVSIYITQLNPPKQEPGGRFFFFFFPPLQDTETFIFSLHCKPVLLNNIG